MTGESGFGIEALGSWTFARADERLTIRREPRQESWQLVIDDKATSRLIAFSELARLVTFQHDMEAFLVRTGWSLADFTPDHRDGSDRRGFPRETNDRRRWWTDIVRGGSVQRPRTPGAAE